MIYPKIPLAQTLISLCKSKGVRHIVISPGSRNAPLIIGFTNDIFFKCYSIVDERSAAFFALGIAQQLRQPVAVVCSSGSALLNYYPAISEAYYSNIPLIVLSADRPKHLIGIGDGQTINQKNVYKNHILYAANLKLDLKDEMNTPSNEELPIMKNIENKLERLLGLQKDIQVYNEEEINLAINIAVENQGPVHINIPFDEPLYHTVTTLSVAPKRIDADSKEYSIEDYTLKECLEYWNNAEKKMILVGVNYPNSIEKKWLDELAKDDSVVVFTEATSNLHNTKFFPSIDQIIDGLTETEKKQLSPDILITFGGLIISKKIKALLRQYQPKQHWHIDQKNANDTFFCLNKHLEIAPNDFFELFLPNITHYRKSQYNATWTSVKQQRQLKHKTYISTIPFSDLKVFAMLLKTVPNGYTLQLSNSSTIRYVQLFNTNKNLNIFCNRGTSGIDGSTSTAIGGAVATTAPTLCITGDLSFFYDSNALWNNYIPNTFRIIVINNSGGGIFRILPGNKNTEMFDTYFETKHKLTAKHLCAMYDIKYTSATNETELEDALKTFYKTSKNPKLLEVFTPRTLNDEILLNYFEALK